MRTIVLLVLMISLSLPSAVLARSFGQGVTLAKETAISTILDQPAAYVGKKVRVSGLVIDVCSTRGCWLFLAGDRDFDKIRIKVTDGEIVFPMEARGKRATVEGVVEQLELTREEVIAQRRHHAEETGTSFDPASVTAGEKVLRIRGLGADIPGV